MSNWKIDYRVKYHITFTHIDGRIDVKYDSLLIEAATPDDVERIIIYQFENGADALTEFPAGWVSKIHNKELEIDEVIKLWEY